MNFATVAFAAPAAVSSFLGVREPSARPSCPRTTSLSMQITVPAPFSAEPTTLRNRAVFARNQGREPTIHASFDSDLAGTGARVDDPAFASMALRALLGNSHVYESEDAMYKPIFARFAGSKDVRELVRDVAKSEGFRSRFLEKNSSVRFVEICFKVRIALQRCGKFVSHFARHVSTNG
jgi:Phycobilisome Linker polypeptide